eukprot:scaffold14886_cov127-Isochrysis_galbana.AAC.1
MGVGRPSGEKKWLPALCAAWSPPFLFVVGAWRQRMPSDTSGREDVRRRSVKGPTTVDLNQALCASSGLGGLPARAGRPGLDVPDCCWLGA